MDTYLQIITPIVIVATIICSAASWRAYKIVYSPRRGLYILSIISSVVLGIAYTLALQGYIPTPLYPYVFRGAVLNLLVILTGLALTEHSYE